MKWYITSDIKYFINTQENILFKGKEILLLPENENVVIEKIKSFSDVDWKGFIVVDTQRPTTRIESLFDVEELEDEDYLTTQEKYYKVSMERALDKKLGMKTRRSNITYNDMRGFEEVIDILNDIDRRSEEDPNFVNKPIFLLGMAGTGKSRIAEAYAGEHKIPLIDLNISTIAEDEKPIHKLNRAFGALSSYGEKACLRLDEFEQMSKNEELLGEMLTILNDLNKGGYVFKGMIFFTSNNISEITRIMPQFFRHGRFIEKLFISFPKKENAMKQINYFNKEYDINFSEKDLERIYFVIDNMYKDVNFTWLENRSAYVPAEYEAFFSVLKDKRLSVFDKETAKIVADEVKPLISTAKEGVERMYQKAKEQDFREI